MTEEKDEDSLGESLWANIRCTVLFQDTVTKRMRS